MVYVITNQSLSFLTHRGYLGQSENVGYLLNLSVLLYLHLSDDLFCLITDFWGPTEHLKITSAIQDKIMQALGNCGYHAGAIWDTWPRVNSSLNRV